MGTYKLRDYQQAASDAAVSFFMSRSKSNSVMVLPTGAGKSLVIADIANRLDSNIIVFGPSQEIIKQNYEKMLSYGCMCCSVYSASLKSKEIDKITFASIQSVANHMDDFRHFKYVIVDECN